MSISFIGLPSVSNRTIFTKNATIVKPPSYLQSGNNLSIASPDEVLIPNGSFNASHVGFDILISDPITPNARNSGIFKITQVLSPTRLKLRDANFDVLNESKYVEDLCRLANALATSYNAHIEADGIHPNDGTNFVTANFALNLPTVKALILDIASQLTNHAMSGPVNYQNFDDSSDIHYFRDPNYLINIPSDLSAGSLYLTLNALKSRFDEHRQNRFFHTKDDFANSVKTDTIPGQVIPPVKPVPGGPILGPYNWVLSNPRTGVSADDPSDVQVKVNGSVANVDAVFGPLGAIVLKDIPPPLADIKITYNYIPNTPNEIKRLNSWEYVLNEEKNLGTSGLPGRKYRQRSFLAPYLVTSALKSPYQPYKIDRRWKAYEYDVTASLNNPNTLLLNVPTNVITFPVYSELVPDQNISYNAVSLPENAVDKWQFIGDGIRSIESNFLVVEDPHTTYAATPGPPIYYHPINLEHSSIVNYAIRGFASDARDYVFDGVFSGVGFGINTGQKTVIVGFIKDVAKEITSAFTLAKDLKLRFNRHLLETGVHKPNDVSDSISLNDPTNVSNLILLCNEIKNSYLEHLLKGPDNIHQSIDIFNNLNLADLTSTSTVTEICSFLNQYRTAFNAHLVQSSVHYFNDTKNNVDFVKQVGILNSDALPEVSSSWSSVSHDWSIETVYRVYVDPSGNARLYVNGAVQANVQVGFSLLPNASSQDLQFNEVNQIFFGSLSDLSTNKSYWKLLRCNIIPIDTLVVGTNKTVSYEPTSVPDEHGTSWISIGNSGDASIITLPVLLEDRLQIDSMSYVTALQASESGIVTGEFRGYLRIEPSLTPENVVDITFTTNNIFNSFSVDNRSHCVTIGDGQNAVIFSLLQLNPQPATVFSTAVVSTANLLAGDLAVFSFDGVNLKSFGYNPLIPLEAQFDAAAGIIGTATIQANGTIKLVSSNSGADSKLIIYGGGIFRKLGIIEATYLGVDSKPEPKFSYTGMDLPEFNDPTWSAVGSQPSIMQNRQLLISDSSFTDYKYYLQDKRPVVGDVITVNNDYIVDFRFKVESYIRGDQVNVSVGDSLFLCGACVAVDEGSLTVGSLTNYGKTFSVFLAEDVASNKFVYILSYDPVTNYYEFVQKIAFNWFDGKFHNYTLTTNKALGTVVLNIDSALFSTFSYSALKTGVDGPNLTFGSVGKFADNVEIRQSQSVTLWTNVTALRNSGSSSGNRYIAIYKGGDPSLRSSYYSYQHDWKVETTYRIVRDPIVGVSVYLSGDVPVINASYDVLSLPLASVDHLSKAVPSTKFIAFGSFNPFEIIRSTWGDIVYSIGRISPSTSIIKNNQILNLANVITSPEHLYSSTAHSHEGQNIYSGGTPTDEFLATFSASHPLELLGDKTAPFVLSQNLESQGGLRLVKTSLNNIDSQSLIYSEGQQGFLENDDVNQVTAPNAKVTNDAQNEFTLKLAEVINKYNAHLSKTIFGSSTVHQIPDVANLVSPPTLWIQAIPAVNSLTGSYNAHRITPGVHYNNDVLHSDNSAVAVGLTSAITRLNSFVDAYNEHLNSSGVHDSNTIPLDDLPDYIALVNDLRAKFNDHLNNTTVHNTVDTLNLIPSSFPAANDLISAVNLANLIRANYESHRIKFGASNVHVVSDSTNFVNPSSASYTLGSLTNLLDSSNPTSLTSRFNSHRVFGGPGPHINNTDPNLVLFQDPSIPEYLIRIMDQVKIGMNSHFLDLTVHNVPDLISYVTANAVYASDFTVDSISTDSIIDFVNSLYESVLDHYKRIPVHNTEDYYTYGLSVIPPNTVTFPCQNLSQCLDMVIDIRNKLNIHYSAVVGGPTFMAHGSVDVPDIATKTNLVTPIAAALQLSNELLIKSNLHFDRKLSHLKIGRTVRGPRYAELVSEPLPQAMQFKVNSSFWINVDGTKVRVKNLNLVRDRNGLIAAINQAVYDPPLLSAAPISHQIDANGQSRISVHGLNVPYEPNPSLSTIELYEDFPLPITAAANSSGLVRLTVNNHGLSNGDVINVFGFVSSPLRNDLNKRWSVTVVDPDHFTLDGSTWSAITFYSGSIQRYEFPFDTEQYADLSISNVTNGIGLITITCSNHGLFTGDAVTITGVVGVPANGVWNITKVDNNTFTLNGSIFSGSYVSGGSVDFNSTSIGFMPGQVAYGVNDYEFSSANNTETVILLTNALKLSYDEHRIEDGVHVINDTTNVPVGSIATDLDSAILILNDLKSKYNSHLIQDGVHGNVALIRFTTPNDTMKILYQSLSLFEQSTGEKDLTSSFSDDGGGSYTLV